MEQTFRPLLEQDVESESTRRMFRRRGLILAEELPRVNGVCKPDATVIAKGSELQPWLLTLLYAYMLITILEASSTYHSYGSPHDRESACREYYLHSHYSREEEEGGRTLPAED